MKKISSCKLVGILALLAGVLVLAWLAASGGIFSIFKDASSFKGQFNGQSALRDVEYQVGLGARIPGSEAHRLIVEWMVAELEKAGWAVEVQESEQMGHPVRNIVARWGSGRPWVVLGAHYDSRLVADQDPDIAKRQEAVPGANDGASGVAVLLEMARVLPVRMQNQPDEQAQQVWLVFFDAEDQGNLPDWDWILGSRAFVSGLTEKPDSAVIVDMIGDANLNMYMERNSDVALTQEIWARAAELGYEQQFISQWRYQILDDHIPFLQAGIPAVDLIDFDYVYWHTTQDTVDKVSAASLQAVGDVLLVWLTE